MPRSLGSIDTRDVTHARRCWWLVALTMCLAAAPWAARAQAPDGDPLRAAGLNSDLVHPISEPQRLAIGGAPAFRFAIELVNLGQPMPGAPARALAEGTGTAFRGLRTTFWRLQFARLTSDRQVLTAMGPLASVEIDVATENPMQRSFSASYRGMGSSAPPGSALRALMVQFVNIAAHGVLVPPPRPVAPNGAVYDISEVANQALRVSFGGAQLAAPIAPAMAAGLIEIGARNALLARLSGQTAARTAQGDVPLRVEGFAAIDRQNGLPLLARTRFFGVATLPAFRGPIDMTITFALVPEGAGDAAAALPPSPRLVAAPAAVGPSAPPPGIEGPPAGTEGPPADTVDAPAQPRAPAKPAAAPKPPAASKPPAEKPAAAAPPKPPAAAGDDVTRRLEQLKSLFDRGLITKEQYEAKQKEILGAL